MGKTNQFSQNSSNQNNDNETRNETTANDHNMRKTRSVQNLKQVGMDVLTRLSEAAIAKKQNNAIGIPGGYSEKRMRSFGKVNSDAYANPENQKGDKVMTLSESLRADKGAMPPEDYERHAKRQTKSTNVQIIFPGADRWETHTQQSGYDIVAISRFKGELLPLKYTKTTGLIDSIKDEEWINTSGTKDNNLILNREIRLNTINPITWGARGMYPTGKLLTEKRLAYRNDKKKAIATAISLYTRGEGKRAHQFITGAGMDHRTSVMIRHFANIQIAERRREIKYLRSDPVLFEARKGYEDSVVHDTLKRINKNKDFRTMYGDGSNKPQAIYAGKGGSKRIPSYHANRRSTKH